MERPASLMYPLPQAGSQRQTQKKGGYCHCTRTQCFSMGNGQTGTTDGIINRHNQIVTSVLTRRLIYKEQLFTSSSLIGARSRSRRTLDPTMGYGSQPNFRD